MPMKIVKSKPSRRNINYSDNESEEEGSVDGEPYDWRLQSKLALNSDKDSKDILKPNEIFKNQHKLFNGLLMS